MIKKLFCLIPLLLISYSYAAIAPNPLISKFKPIFASFSGSPSPLVNGKFGETAWMVTDSSWVAIKLDMGPSKAFFVWNSTNYMWSDSMGKPGNCVEGLPVPLSYKLFLSSNSTNAIDGDWKVVDSVSDNHVASRGHIIDLSGSFWIKMQIFSGGGKIDEIEVYDVSNGHDDTWFFAGTSITANAFKGPVQLKTFRDYLKDIVVDVNPKATPAFIRGGNGCITSSGLAADISKYLEVAGNVKYFAIEIGTNDAWGGSATNAATYAGNLQKIIDACKAKKVEPIIARIPATNAEVATWQIHEDYLKAIDNVVKKNRLIPGPDLYAWFLQHSDELKADGIHPSPRGGASIQRLWAEAVYKLYQDNGKK